MNVRTDRTAIDAHTAYRPAPAPRPTNKELFRLYREAHGYNAEDLGTVLEWTREKVEAGPTAKRTTGAPR